MLTLNWIEGPKQLLWPFFLVKLQYDAFMPPSYALLQNSRTRCHLPHWVHLVSVSFRM